MRLNERIKYYREKRRLTQKEVSRRSGIHVSQISHIENDNEAKFSNKFVVPLCKALGVTPNMLFELCDKDVAVLNDNGVAPLTGRKKRIIYVGSMLVEAKTKEEAEEKFHMDDFIRNDYMIHHIE